MIATAGRNVRFALRLLGRSPGFSLIAVATLALGIGATSAIFSLLYEVLLRPLPYPEPDRLVQIETVFAAGRASNADGERALFWQRHITALRDVAIVGGGGEQNLAGGSEPQRVRMRGVTAGFFRLLGTPPVLGRDFQPGEDTAAAPLAILGYGLWQRRFGGEPGVLGRGLTLGTRSYTIAGVAPPNLDPTLATDIWTPLDVRNDPEFGGQNFLVLGRLPDGVPMEQAQADLEVVARQYRAAHPKHGDAKESARAFPYQQETTAAVRPALLVLAAAVGLVLLIACANVANLLLARVAGRRREIAIRLAVGASRTQVVGQLLVESLCLALAGGLLGLTLAHFAIAALVSLNPPDVANLDRVSLNGPVLLFTLAASMLTGILFGLVPALQAAGGDGNEALAEGGARGGDSRAGHRLREVLVATQFALSLVLLIGASLLGETFMKLRRVEPGFDTRHVLTMKVSVSGPGYETAGQVARFADGAVDRLNRLPGVRTAAVTNYLPLEGGFNIPLESIAGQPNPERRFLGNLQWFGVTPGFFEAMGMRLENGRPFDVRDNAAGAGVVMVNEAFVRKYLPRQEPIGKQILIAWSMVGPDAADRLRQIVGVVNDLHEQSLASEPEPSAFVPLPQINDAVSALVSHYLPMVVVARTGGDPLALSREAVGEIHRAAGSLPVYDVRSMAQVAGGSIHSQRFMMALVAAFGLLALALATIGIYGVMSYAVARRSREFGIRAALGAAPSRILGMVVARGLVMAAAGIAAGTAGALVLTRLLAGLLYGVTARDPVAFIAAPVVLTLAALTACYVPARRAVKVDPLTALRWE